MIRVLVAVVKNIRNVVEESKFRMKKDISNELNEL